MDLATLTIKVDPTPAVDGLNRVEKELTDVANQADTTRSKLDGSVNSPGLRDGAEKSKSAFSAIVGSARGAIGAIAGIGAAYLSVGQAIESIRVTAAFENDLQRLKATAELTNEELARLADTARQVGRSDDISASQSVQALTGLAEAGLNASEQIAALPAVLNVAEISNRGFAESASLVARGLAQYGGTAADAARFSDLLTTASVKTAGSFNDIANAVVAIGPTARNANASLEDTVAVIGALADAGQGGTRGTLALRGILQGLINPSSAAKKELEALGIGLEEVDLKSVGLVGALDRLSKANIDADSATRLFSARSAGAAVALLSNVDRVKQLQEELNNSQGSAQRFSDTLDDSLSSSFTALGTAFQNLRITSTFTEPIRTAVDAVTNFVRALDGAQTESEGINNAVDSIRGVIDSLVASFELAGDGIGQFFGFVVDAIRVGVANLQDVVTVGISVFGRGGLSGAIESVAEVARATVNFIIGGFRTVFEVIERASTGIGTVGRGIVTSLQQAVSGEFQRAQQTLLLSTVQGAAQAASSVSDITQTLLANVRQDYVGEGLQTGKEFVANFYAGLASVQARDIPVFDDVLTRIEERRQARAKRAQDEELARLKALEEAKLRTLRGGDSGEEIPQPQFESQPAEDATKAVADYREQLAGLFAELEIERDLFGKTNDERERAEKSAQALALATKLYGDDQEAVNEVLQEYLDLLNDVQSSRAFERMRDMVEEIENETNALGKSRSERENAAESLRFYNEALRAYKGDTDAATESTRNFQEILEERNRLRDLQQLADNIGDSFGESFERAAFEFDNLQDVLEDGIKNISRLIFQELVTKQIAGFASGIAGSIFGLPGSSGATPGIFGGLFGGRRAAGGRVFAGSTYLVGEDSPELFTPTVSGEIIPQGRMQQQRTGVPNVTLNVYARDASSFRRSSGQIQSQFAALARRV